MILPKIENSKKRTKIKKNANKEVFSKKFEPNQVQI